MGHSSLSASRNAASVAGRHRTSAVRRRFAEGLFVVATLAIFFFLVQRDTTPDKNSAYHTMSDV